MKSTVLRNEGSPLPPFVIGGGEMGQRIRDHDWSKNPVGVPENWPQSLRTTLGIIINSHFPMFLFWGSEHICFYNDAYRPSLGNEGKHPEALGQPGAVVWPEIWPSVKPLIDQVLAGHGATWSEDQPWAIYRNGRMEEAYWTFSYSPVPDESGTPMGVFVACTETTEKVINLKQLEESKKQLEFAIDAAELGTWDMDVATRMFTGNSRLKEWFGLPPQATLPLSLALQSIAPADRERVTLAIDKALHHESGGHYDIEFTVVNPLSHTGRIVRAKGKSWFNENRIAYQFNGILQDVTAQVLARQTIEASELYFRNMADTVPVTLWITDKEGQCTYMNRYWFEMTGQTSEEALGVGWLNAVHPDDRAKAEEAFFTAIAQLISFHVVYRLRSQKGDYRWMIDKGEPRFDESGIFEGYTGSMVDVHEQKLAEETVRQSEKRFQAAINAVQGILWTNNAHGEMEGEQPGWAALTGQSYEQYQGYGWATAVHPEDAQPTIHAWNEAVRDCKPFIFEHRVRMKNNSWRQFSIRAMPISDIGGTIREWVGVHTDITEKILAEQALKEREERYRSLFETMDQGFAIIEMIFDDANQPIDYRFLECNPVFEHQTGLVNAIGKTAIELVPNLEERWFHLYGNVALTGEANRFVEGSEVMGRWFEVYAFRLGGGVSRRVALLFTDISQRRHSEMELKESESRFRILVETLPQMVWVMDGNGRTEYASGRWKEYSGIEDSVLAWQLMRHPADLDIEQQWQEAFTVGDSFRADVRLKNKLGEYRWHTSVVEPVKDAAGHIVKWIGALTDIHDRKISSAQLEKMIVERTYELQRSNEDLQQFAHVASHDLKEPVRKIKLFSNFLATKYADSLPEDGALYLSKIQDAASRMHAMIDGVLLYSSLSAAEQSLDLVDLNRIIHTIEGDLEIVIKQKNAAIRYANLPVIEGFSVLLHQLFYNLINNSLKFTREEVYPVIVLEAEIKDPDLVQGDSPEQPAIQGTYARIRLQDNGIGFRTEDARKIFKTFVRLNSKDQYEGTGLGLALCHRIVERHGGRITADGKMGQGAVFVIDLPLRRSSHV